MIVLGADMLHAYDDEQDDHVVAPLTAQEAQAWREKNPSVPLWSVIGWQALSGVLTALAVWGFSGQGASAWSALYGAMSVTLPSAIFARALLAKPAPTQAMAHVVRLLGWEAVKLLLCAAMLLVAPRLIENLSWLALLAGLVVALKVYWLVLLVRPKPRKI
ncbi:MAG: ATP synthase subunit I [Burkholderiaceae bacterium]